MPSVAAISEQVLGGAGVVRHSDATYYLAGEGSANYEWYREAAMPAINFCSDLRELADTYFRDRLDLRAANYEDVANLAKQIADAVSGEYENPALLPLLSELAGQPADVTALMHRADEARDYIRDIVWRMLNRPVGDVSHLRAIVEGCDELGATDIFELNHDRVAEKALADAGIEVADGFTRGAGDVTFWTDVFDRPVRHFYLHGSITWFHRAIPDEPWRGLVVARSTTGRPYHDRDSAGERLEFPVDGRPVFLTGTFDKSLAYDSTVYADQHYRFHESLRTADAVVVIGYGFRDKAINARLVGWWHRDPNHRLVVAHGDVQSLIGSARPAIAGMWNSRIRDGRLRVVDKWIADTSWTDFTAALTS
jgi:hypothetical protein